jgi:hypothetical protein
MATKLTDLPMELLANISSYLLTVELGNLRRTCKFIEQVLFRQFAMEFFSTRQICLYPTSLDSLTQISLHPELKNYVRRVIIGLDHIPIQMNAMQNASVADGNQLYMRYKYMATTQSWKGILTAALKRLPVNSIQIRDSISPGKRPREQTEWRSYGVPTFLQNNNYPVNPALSSLGGNLAGDVLAICAEANIQLESIDDITRLARNATSIYTLTIPPELYDSYSVAFAGLKKLFLSLGLDELSTLQFSGALGTGVESFFRLLPNVEHLRLNFMISSSPPPHNLNYGQQAAACTILNASRAFKGKKLKNLELGMANLTANQVFNALDTLKDSLEHIGLVKIALGVSASWSGLFDQLEKMNQLKVFMANTCFGEEQVAWRVAPDVKLRFHKAASRVWPASHKTYLVGDSGAAIAEQARSLIAFPFSEIRDSTNDLPSNLRWVRLLAHEPIKGTDYTSTEDEEENGDGEDEDEDDDFDAEMVDEEEEDEDDDEDSDMEI